MNALVEIGSKITRKIKNHFLRLIYWICRAFPIDETMVVFESEGDFSDNSWALYDYMLTHTKDYHFVWLVHEKKDYPIQARTIIVYHNYAFNTIKDVLILSRAKYLFYTHGLGNDIRPRAGQKVVNLWHGVPVKGIKNMSKEQKIPPFNHVLCLSEMNASFVTTFLNCDSKYARPLGCPRNDLLFNHKDIGVHNPFVPKGFDGKVIIWMPTFRKSWSKLISEDICDNETGLPLLCTNESLDEFNVFLNSINVCVIVKIHHLQAGKETFKHDRSNLIFVQDEDINRKGLQLYQVIAKTDALLTDYSSVFMDYFLMNRPIGFILDDLEEYEKSRGAFLFTPVTDLLAGSHIYNIEQLRYFCKEIADEVDSTKDYRNRIASKMIKYQDGNSCKRIIQFVGMNMYKCIKDERVMIPKIIHYCWFGRSKKPALAEKCINSWRKYLPEYEIKEWNEDTFDLDIYPYAREAYDNRKYAFVTDVVRLYALCEEGGIYMDTDVEVLSSLDPFLKHHAFSGFEDEKSIPTGIMASEKGGKWVKELLDYYDGKHFLLSNGEMDLTTNVVTITNITQKYGLVRNNSYQELSDIVTFYPNDFFCPKSHLDGQIYRTGNTVCIHHFAGSWIPKEQKIESLFWKMLGVRPHRFMWHVDNILFKYFKIKR